MARGPTVLAMARTEQPDRIEGLNELAAVFGVSVQTVKRRLAAGQWPEVSKTEGTYGETWSLDRALVQQIADRENWVLDLRDDQGQDTPPHVEALLQALFDGRREQTEHLERATKAEALLAAVEADRDRQTAAAKRATSDLEQERAEVSRLTTELSDTRRQLAIAETQAVERQHAVDASGEQIAKLSDELAGERAAAEAARAEAARLAASMGWWSRRRAAKRT